MMKRSLRQQHRPPASTSEPHATLKSARANRPVRLKIFTCLENIHALPSNASDGAADGRLKLDSGIHVPQLHSWLHNAVLTGASSSSARGGGGGGLFGGSSGGGGGGGDGESSGTGGAHSFNVLAQLAANAEGAEEDILLDVGGMLCGGCVGHVKAALESQPGVLEVVVDLESQTAKVKLLVPKGHSTSAQLLVTVEKLIQVLQKEGYTAAIHAAEH